VKLDEIPRNSDHTGIMQSFLKVLSEPFPSENQTVNYMRLLEIQTATRSFL